MRAFLFILMTFFLSSCGFELQGKMQLAPPLHTLYLQAPDPYGALASSLQLYLKMSGVTLATSPEAAQTKLVIQHDGNSEELLSVSSTQQTRQYNLKVTVIFTLEDRQGRTILEPQTLVEARVITVQSNQVLANSNVANLYYQQMRRAIAYALMNRLASQEVTLLVNQATVPAKKAKKL